MRRLQLFTCLALALAGLVALAPQGNAQRPKPSSEGSSGRPSGGGSSRPSAPSPRPSAPSPSPRPSTQPSAPRPSSPAPRPSVTPSRPSAPQPSFDAPRPSAGNSGGTSSGRPSTTRPPSYPGGSSSGNSGAESDRSGSAPARDTGSSSTGVRYLPRTEDRAPTSSGAGSVETPGGSRTRFPRSSSSVPPAAGGRDELPTIGTVQPRPSFPRLLGSQSGESQGMGPSATRLARVRDGLAGSGRRTGAQNPAIPGAELNPALPGAPAMVDELAGRYRRPAVDPSVGGDKQTSGPANGRVARARADAAKLAGDKDPIANANPSDKRVAAARATAALGSEGDSSSEMRPMTLREKAYANPVRTRHHLANQPGGPGQAAGGVGGGINYGLGWPNAGGSIAHGCWDDDWTVWIDSCHGGGYAWPWHGNSHWWWHANYWGYWPWGCGWWSAFWYPVFWYSSYSPAQVIVYQDTTPQTVYVEAPPAYPEEPAPTANVGEAVLDENADPDARAVDESMGRLLSQDAVSASRAATQNLGLGDAAFREGRYGDAVHFYAKAIEFQPDQGVLYLVLSDALFATGDYHYGAYALRKALELDPTLVNEPVDKHGFYSDPKEFERQLAVLETYLKDRPTDTDARLLLAANYLFGLRPAAAVDLLEAPASEAVRNSPSGALLLQSARKLQYGATAAPAK
jgi:hypothetical protein